MQPMADVVLQSSDGAAYNLPIHIATLSSLVQDVLEHCTDDGCMIIPLPKVPSIALGPIVEWMHRKMRILPQFVSTPHECGYISEHEYGGRDSELSNWERLFFHRLDKGVLFMVLNAANYMGINSLIGSGSSYVAEMISGMELEEAKVYLNVSIENAANMESIQEKYSWVTPQYHCLSRSVYKLISPTFLNFGISARSARTSGNQRDVSKINTAEPQACEQHHDAGYEEALNLPSTIPYPPSSPPAYQSPRNFSMFENRDVGDISNSGSLNDLILSKVTLPFQQMIRKTNYVDEESESENHEYTDPVKNTIDGFDADEVQLMSFIDDYHPEEIRPRPLLKPFIMDYIPAIGDIDAMIKIPRPDEVEDNIGLIELDEPAVQQSDPTILTMQLRNASKEVNAQIDAPVKQLERADRSTHEIDRWISDIKELHRTRPSQSTVQFRGPMPDIESLMQEFHPHFEKSLEGLMIPSGDLDVDLEEYTDICLGLLDIPITRGRIQSLHCFFSLYREFKNSQHFKNLALNVTEKRKTIDRMEL
ncbi:Skp1 family, dimerization domain protein [Dictyocaulus viviparus]|uniref:Intraflagellar transport protein 46 homolog n=1 Tax=Dictyocaulus viviparus TaxID=29172 RepID=A0A0D8XEU4_DICVI|nr:Skp1 family, dimerization domain protein [Dictyocaulus viviparus]